MFRMMVVLLLLGGMVAVASAESIHRCRKADGSLVFTDDPAEFPPGCRELPGSEPPAPKPEEAAAPGDREVPAVPGVAEAELQRPPLPPPAGEPARPPMAAPEEPMKREPLPPVAQPVQPPPVAEELPVAAEPVAPSPKELALALVEEYRQAIASRVTSLPPAEVQRARGKVLEIRQRRDELLQGVAAGAVSPAERAEVERILAQIP